MDELKSFFSGRLNRRNYFSGGLMCVIIVLASQWILSSLRGTVSSWPIAGFLLILDIVLLIMFVFSVSLQVRRAHDLGHSGWWLLWLLVPLANIVVSFMLLLKPGDEVANKYGEVPQGMRFPQDILAIN